MRVNVSGLLRDFARVRKAALSGERVVVTTREGNLVLTAETSAASELFGALSNIILSSDDDIDRPTLPNEHWLHES